MRDGAQLKGCLARGRKRELSSSSSSLGRTLVQREYGVLHKATDHDYGEGTSR